MMYVITRPVGAVSLNGKEFVLDSIEGGKVRVFKTKEEAWGYLYSVGISDDEADRQAIQVEESLAPEEDEEEVVGEVYDD